MYVYMCVYNAFNPVPIRYPAQIQQLIQRIHSANTNWWVLILVTVIKYTLPAYKYHYEYHFQNLATLSLHLFVIYCTVWPYGLEELVHLLSLIRIVLVHDEHIWLFYMISMSDVLSIPNVLVLEIYEVPVRAIIYD